MIQSLLPALGNHLWQSTFVIILVGVLNLILRGNRAAVRHKLWLVASLKFLLPFSIVALCGAFIQKQAPPVARSPISIAVTYASEPFNPGQTLIATSGADVDSGSGTLPFAIVAVWAAGFLWSMTWWAVGWLRIRQIVRNGKPLRVQLPLPIVLVSHRIEPGVWGVLKPVLILPEDIADRLTADELDAVLTHEMCHVRRRDNLTAGLHLCVESLFWFHPLVWWIKARLLHEQERACDEEVIRLGGNRGAYAETILKVCELYVTAPPLVCAGISGAGLRERVREIMANGTVHKLTWSRILLLSVAGITALTIPILVGAVRSQQLPTEAGPSSRLEFELASLRPSGPPHPPQLTNLIQGGPGTKEPERITGPRVTLQRLLTVAYGVDFDQIQGPAWTGEERYDLIAKVPPGMTRDQIKFMLQNLMAERFKLILHHVSKDLPVYELAIAKSGARLQETREADLRPMRLGEPTPLDHDGFPQLPTGAYGCINAVVHTLTRMTCRGMPLSFLASELAVPLGTGEGNTFAVARIVNRTGLTGKYDFKLEYSGAYAPGGALSLPEPEIEPGGGLPLAAAVQKQLGLKLTKSSAPFDVLVIDHAERVPTEN
jgi:uncharacterized protein (TIGR03435 family)